jgi:hypothetical protein
VSDEIVMSTDLQSTQGVVSGTTVLEPEPELPPWAAGVMRSSPAAPAAPDQMSTSGYDERVDDRTRLHYVYAPGVIVVSLDSRDQQLKSARDLIRRLREHELDLAAVVLPSGDEPSPESVERLAAERIAVVRAEGASPRDRAIRFVTAFLAKRDEGRAQTKRFAEYASAKRAGR